jgi:phosphate starvation-inducible protein PhoH and related proteins
MAEQRKRKPTTTPTTEVTGKPVSKKELIGQIIKRKTKEKFLTANQKKYYDTLIDSEITVCSGPAGTGKSYISMKAAIDLLSDPETPYEKIIIIRPIVEGGDSRLGSLPGSYEEKMEPYISPSYYLLNKIIGKESREKLKDGGFIEVLSISYLRGFNIDNSICVVEESQNTTPLEMKLILTRIGFNSKFFISGDIEQSDKFKDKEKSGLYDAIKRLNDVKGIGISSFTDNDVVRNPIIKEIIRRYND